MANTIDTMTPEEILRGIVDGTLTEFIDENVTILQAHGFRYHPSIVTISCPNLTRVYTRGLGDCKNLQHIHIGTATISLGSGETQASVLVSNNDSQTMALEELSLQGYVSSPNICAQVKSIKKIDLGPNATNITNQSFDGCTNLSVLVLRRTANITGLGQAPQSWTFRGTKFMSGNGKVYVPNALLSDYTAHTNWGKLVTTYNNQFLPIEGSEYEHYYVDGTPVPTT